MLTDELTVFDIKYNEGIERLNNLLSSESSTSSIKNYVERYKLDKSRENRISQKNNTTSNNRNSLKEDKRKQIVDIYEIRDHDKKVQQLLNKNYLKNEIEWFKIKKREDEHKNKYNYNKTKFDNDRQDINKDIIRNNNLKMKKFSNLANKVNIEKFMQIKKLNQNLNRDKNTNSEQKARTQLSNNNIQDGVFIPYSEYKEYEMNKNKKMKINLKDINNYNNNKSIKGNINILNNKNKKINRNNNIIKSSNISKRSQNKYNNQNNNNINKSQSINNINNINNNNIQGIHTNIIKTAQSPENNKNRIKSTASKNTDNRYKIDIRKPLDKKIDYLRERKTSQDHRVKIYESKNMNLLNNIELLNFHSKNYENKAKMQEQLMRVKGTKQYGNDDNVKLSNLLIDSISTKLAILNQISS